MLAKIARNTTYLTLSGALASALAVLNLPQMVAAVGLDGLGRIVVMQSITATVAAILMPQTWQSIAKFAARGDNGFVRDLSSPLFGWGYLFEMAGGMLSLTVTAAILLFFLPADYQRHLAGFLLVIAGTVFSNARVSDQVLREREMYSVLAASQVLCQGLKVLVLLLLFNYADFFDVCLLIFAAEFLRLLGIVILGRRGLAKIRFRELFSTHAIGKNFLSSVFWINVSDIIDLPVRHVDKIVTSALLGPAAAGVFAIFKKLAGVFGIVADALYQATYPVLARLIAVDQGKALAMARNIGKTFFAAGILPLLVLVTFSSLWVPLVIPTLKTDVSLEIAIFFTASFVAMCFIMVHPLYILYGHEKHNASVTAVANGIYLGALWMLTSRHGLLGAVVACAIQYFLVISIKVVHLRLRIRSEGRPLPS